MNPPLNSSAFRYEKLYTVVPSLLLPIFVSKSEKATRQWMASSFRENSSNEIEPAETFWKKSYEPPRGVSRNFWEINIFIFNEIRKWSTLPAGAGFWAKCKFFPG
jgi:hypothetical protein